MAPEGGSSPDPNKEENPMRSGCQSYDGSGLGKTRLIGWSHLSSTKPVLAERTDSHQLSWVIASTFQVRRRPSSHGIALIALEKFARRRADGGCGISDSGCGVRSSRTSPPHNRDRFAEPSPRSQEKGQKRDMVWQREHLALTSKHLPDRGSPSR